MFTISYLTVLILFNICIDITTVEQKLIIANTNLYFYNRLFNCFDITKVCISQVSVKQWLSNSWATVEQ